MADPEMTTPDERTRASEAADAAKRPDPSRGPTTEEEAAADRAAQQTDLAAVGERYESYLQTAKEAAGEGRIEPG